jgi:hypothetical protein
MSFQCVAADSNKKFLPLAFSISHVFNGNRSRAKLGWAKSGDSKFIAWIADFANMSGRIFDLATHDAKPVFPLPSGALTASEERAPCEEYKAETLLPRHF